MGKVISIILIILCIIGCSVLGYLYYTKTEETKTLIADKSALEAQINSIGPTTKGWTVKAPVISGLDVKRSDLVECTVAISGVDVNNLITDVDSLKGMYYKVDIKPGTTLTKDLVSVEDPDVVLYERDLALPYLPVGTLEGDYLDIRVVFPMGEDLIALEHKRVEKIIDFVCKFKLDETELAIYNSVITDVGLYGENGFRIYPTKYVEPGLGDEVVPLYPVRAEVAGSIMLNKNIVNKERAVNAALRQALDLRLAAVPKETGTKIKAAVVLEESLLAKAYNTWKDETARGVANGTAPADGTAQTDPNLPAGTDPNATAQMGADGLPVDGGNILPGGDSNKIE